MALFFRNDRFHCWVLSDEDVNFCVYPGIAAEDRRRMPEPRAFTSHRFYRVAIIRCAEAGFVTDAPTDREAQVGYRTYEARQFGYEYRHGGRLWLVLSDDWVLVPNLRKIEGGRR